VVVIGVVVIGVVVIGVVVIGVVVIGVVVTGVVVIGVVVTGVVVVTSVIPQAEGSLGVHGRGTVVVGPGALIVSDGCGSAGGCWVGGVTASDGCAGGVG